VLGFQRRQEVAAAHPRRHGNECPLIAVGATGNSHERPGKRVRVVDVGGAGGRKVPLIGEIGPFRELHAAHELRNQKIQVGVAVAVGVRWEVHRHPRHRGREVRAVIQIESTQIVLVGLSFTAVLTDDHPGDGLEHFASPRHRPRIELPRRDGALARRLRDPDEILRRILGVREVRERRLAGHGDIGAQG
jgi:hypothetical protein